MKAQKQTSGGNVTHQCDGLVAAWNPWSARGGLRETKREIDIHETDEMLQVLAALPGYTIEQIDVHATDRSIFVWGNRTPVFEDSKVQACPNLDQSDSRRFYFSYMLPVNIDPERIRATFANGVLQLELPKTERACARSVQVNVVAA